MPMIPMVQPAVHRGGNERPSNHSSIFIVHRLGRVVHLPPKVRRRNMGPVMPGMIAMDGAQAACCVVIGSMMAIHLLSYFCGVARTYLRDSDSPDADSGSEWVTTPPASSDTGPFENHVMGIPYTPPKPELTPYQIAAGNQSPRSASRPRTRRDRDTRNK